MKNVLKDGYDVGRAYTDKQQVIQALIMQITSSPVKKYDKIRNDLIKICADVSKPIPAFVMNVNDENYNQVVAFLMGLNNGSLGATYHDETE